MLKKKTKEIRYKVTCRTIGRGKWHFIVFAPDKTTANFRALHQLSDEGKTNTRIVDIRKSKRN